MAGALTLLLIVLLALPALAENCTVHFHTRPASAIVTLMADTEIPLGRGDTALDVPLPSGATILRFRFSHDGYATQFADISSDTLRRDAAPPVELPPTRPDTWLWRHPWTLALVPLAWLAGRAIITARKRRALLAALPDPLVGQTIDRWLLVERLGEGGMGTVFRAVDARTLDQPVAIKILRSTERFEREVRRGLELQHPNLVRILDWGPGYVVMELIDGQTLRRIIPPRGMPFEEALAVMLPVMRAMQFVHEQGVVHRDLKPDNVMITSSGRTVVMDFGIARAVHDATITPRDHITGTLAYMAPEQVESEDTDGRADQYALGVMWFELLTGQRPHEMDDSMPAEVLLLQKSVREAPSIATVRADLKPERAAAIDRMLARRREDRFADLNEAIAKLTSA